MPKKILAIVGSYRKGGIIDTIVDEALAGAEQAGAEVAKIYLVDQKVEFCTNCRTCTQEPGKRRGECIHDDDMANILYQWDDADALVLGAPVNFFNVNAITRRFMERLVCYAYWPWKEKMGPKMRIARPAKKAVLITSSAMPGIMGRVFTGAMRALKLMAKTMGAKPTATIFAGLVPSEKDPKPPKKLLAKARVAGRRLA